MKGEFSHLKRLVMTRESIIERAYFRNKTRVSRSQARSVTSGLILARATAPLIDGFDTIITQFENGLLIES